MRIGSEGFFCFTSLNIQGWQASRPHFSQATTTAGGSALPHSFRKSNAILGTPVSRLMPHTFCEAAPERRLGVRQLAAAFAFSLAILTHPKAQASLRTPRASRPIKKYAALGETPAFPGKNYAAFGGSVHAYCVALRQAPLRTVECLCDVPALYPRLFERPCHKILGLRRASGQRRRYGLDQSIRFSRKCDTRVCGDSTTNKSALARR
jgi:hypothetical protein